MGNDVHLCLLLHGLYGSPANLWCLEEEVAKAHAAAGSHLELAVLNATSYSGPKTWDGVDVIAHGVTHELDAEISRLESEGKRVAFLSVTGYSLGGLIARTLVGQLYARPGFFARHRPAFFSTIATPHLGVLRYGSWRSAWMHAVGQHMFSRTGQQLFCLDSDHGDPFLVVLADPSRIYYRALAQFGKVLLIANGVGDLTVPYCTAAAERHDPFVDYEAGRLGLVVHDHIVKSAFRPQEEDEVDAIVGESLVPAAPTRPWLPPFFYLPYRPVRYVLFPLIPVVVPIALTFAALAMAFHSYSSARRIRALTVHEHHRRPIFGLESSDYDVSGDTPTMTRRNSPAPSRQSTLRNSILTANGPTKGHRRMPSVESQCEVCDDAEETGIPNDVSDNGNASAQDGLGEAVKKSGADDEGEGENGPILAQEGGEERSGPALVPPSQPILTGQQEAMISAISALPQLERLVAWFPGVFNAHAVVVARNARIPRWSWQGVGRCVMAEWARKCVAAVQAAAGAPLPDNAFGTPPPATEADLAHGDCDWEGCEENEGDDDLDNTREGIDRSRGISVDYRDSRTESRRESRRGSREPTAIEVSVSNAFVYARSPSPNGSERSHSIA